MSSQKKTKKTDKEYRHFTVESSSLGPEYEGGSYKVNLKTGTPKGAALKAARRMLKEHKGKKIHFTIRETTRRSDKHLHSYEARLEKLSVPKTRTIANNIIIQTEEVILTPIPIHESTLPHSSSFSKKNEKRKEKQRGGDPFEKDYSAF